MSQQLCFDDQRNYFLVTGLPLALLAYGSVCLSRTSLWLRLLLGLVIAQVGYALLVLAAPGTFRFEYDATMAFTVLGIAAAVITLFVVCASLMVFAGAVIFLVPVLQVNSQWLARQLGVLLGTEVPFWGGVLLLVLVVGAAALLVWKLRLLRALGYAVRIALGSVLLWLYTRVAVLEFGSAPEGGPPPLLRPFGQLRLCCSHDGGERCPLSFENLHMLLYLCVLLMLSAWMALRRSCCCKRLRRWRKGYARADSEPGATPQV